LAGTRIPVDTVNRYIEHGYTDEEIVRSFPALKADDIAAVRRTVA
jgi:uncharacterized protein (DUF433 family)